MDTLEPLTIRKVIQIKAQPELVFDALTDAEQIPLYFPYDSVEAQWKIDGEILFMGQVNDEAFTDFGTIETLDRPNNFRYRYWSDNHGTERLPENHLIISYTLESVAGDTELAIEHSNILSNDYYAVMSEAWDSLLENLKRHLE